MTRKALTRREYLLLCIRQEGKCGCGCGVKLDPMGENVVDEHVIPRMLADPAFVDERDALSNRALFRKPCAAKKTRGDVKQIAKARRQGRESGQQARRAAGKTKTIQGRGFDKTLRRKMDGTVERRT